MSDIYQHKQLQEVSSLASQERQSASLALTPSAPAKSGVVCLHTTKLSIACRSENTRCRQRDRMSIHSVYILDVHGKPLTPTTPAKTRKLLKGGQAKKRWSKFNTFGIQMLVSTRIEVPITALGVDNGAKFEGYSVVCHKENNLSVKLNLPNKKKITRKLKERREARRTRRSRLRRRPARWNNRSRKGFIAPSQLMLVLSRLKIISEFCRIYPISSVGIEDVRFNHFKHRWGQFFSSVEIGKNKIRQWFDDRKIARFEYKGFETAELRKQYGYKKTRVKNADKFSAHCSDSLTLAVDVVSGAYVEPGPFLVVDDTYRCVRRKIHDSNIKKGGIREKYSCGTVRGLQKGLIIGTKKGKIGQLCGENKGRFRYRDILNNRQTCSYLDWINRQFKIKGRKQHSLKPCGIL